MPAKAELITDFVGCTIQAFARKHVLVVLVCDPGLGSCHLSGGCDYGQHSDHTLACFMQVLLPTHHGYHPCRCLQIKTRRYLSSLIFVKRQLSKA